MTIEIDDKTKAAIEAVLSKDQRVELIPTKDGVRVIRVKREEVKKTDRRGDVSSGHSKQRGLFL